MVSATIREVVDEALTIVGEVAGAGVETYSDDRMFSDAIRAFNLLFKKYYWEQFRSWERLELDGILGIVKNDAFLSVRDFEDFYSVHVDGSQKPLPVLPKSINPYTITGTTLRYWTSLAANDENYDRRRLQFWPKSATGFINVCSRVYPIENDAAWDWSDIMYLDKDMLAAGVAYMTFSGDDLNSGAADAQRQLMEMRFRDIKASLADRPMLIAGTGSPIPMDWQTYNNY